MNILSIHLAKKYYKPHANIATGGPNKGQLNLNDPDTAVISKLVGLGFSDIDGITTPLLEKKMRDFQNVDWNGQ